MTRVVGAVRTELVLARIGIGAVALHVVDDSFLQPQPGTAARRPSVQRTRPAGAARPRSVGLSQVACRRACLPRDRRRLHRRLALQRGGSRRQGCGTVGRRLQRLRRAGSLAAAALDRRLDPVDEQARDDRRTWRYLRRALIAVGAAIVILQVAVPTGFAYLITHSAGSSVATAELGTPYEHVSFTTSDGLRIAGWYIPSRNRAAVIAFPGRDITQPHARMLARHGYGVLLFDPRGEGASEGDPNGLGWAGERDLKAALAFLADPPGRRRRSPRRHRPLGRRGDAARDGRRVVRTEGGRLRRRRHAVQP